jgi:shikimate kinase
MSQRVPLYRKVATIRINTNRRNPGAVVRHIVHKLDAAACGRQQAARKRRPAWRRLPTVLNPAPATEAPPSPAALARRAEARND